MGEECTAYGLKLCGRRLQNQEHSSGPPPAAAAAGDDGDAAAQGQSARDAEDREFLEKMRRWLMTVATLFVGMPFQAALHPPDWMPKDWAGVLFSKTIAALSGSPVEDASATITTRQALRAFSYVFLNTITFAMAQTLVIILLVMKKSPAWRTVGMVKALAVLLSLAIASTFASSTSDDLRVVALVTAIYVVYATFLLCIYSVASYIF